MVPGPIKGASTGFLERITYGGFTCSGLMRGGEGLVLPEVGMLTPQGMPYPIWVYGR